MSVEDTLYQIRERATDYREREMGRHSIVSLKIDLDEIARLADGELQTLVVTGRIEMSDIQQAHEEEDVVLSTAVKAALNTMMRICNDPEVEDELRIDAASRILGYASTFQPDISDGMTAGGEEEDGDEEDSIGGTD